MSHGKHMAWMLGLAAVGAVLLLSGVGGGAVLLLWPLACMAMMGAMMWAMSGGGQGRPSREDADEGRRPERAGRP
jgi:hypothetical protein